MLLPPDNFGLVEEGIYRCAKLDPLNFAFLDTLDLKCLILVDAEKPPRALLNFFEDKSTVLYHMGRSGLKPIENQEDSENTETAADSGENLLASGYDKMEDWMILNPNLISEIFEILLNISKHNVLLVDKTETVIGLLRRLQKWSFSSITNEYRLYSASRSNYSTETFLELLKVELVSYEEYELKKKKEEEELQNAVGVPIKRPAHKRSGSSFSRSIEDLKMESIRLDSIDIDDFELLQAEKLSLSLSPQIPHELLKLAKQRKLKKNSVKDDSNDLVKPDDEVYSHIEGYAYYKNHDHQFDDLTNQGKRKKIVMVKLPKEENLPLWFVRQRDTWEKIYKQANNIV